MPHPCRSRADTGGNPSFKMHACGSEDSMETLCGLPEVADVNVLAGYSSLCRTCFPPRREPAWTGSGPDEGNPGDNITGEGREE